MSENWSDADISFFCSPLCSDTILEDLLHKGKFLDPGSKILTLRLPPNIKKIEIKNQKNNLSVTSKQYNNYQLKNENKDMENYENNLNNLSYEKYFYLDEIFWCKMSWGRARVFLLIRNNLK